MARARWLAIVAVALGATALAFQPTTDPDCWWHLRTGQELVARRSLLPTDIFSFSFAGAPWPYKDVLADVLLATLFSTLGFWGLLVLKVAAALALFALLGGAATRERRLPALIAVTVGLWLVPLLERPNLFSMVCFVALLMSLERAHRASTATTWRPLLASMAAPLLVSWIWINLHRGALLAYPLLLGFTVALGLARIDWGPRLRALVGPRPSRRALVVASATALIAPLVGLVNPQGTAPFTTGLAVEAHRPLRTFIAEWVSLGPLGLLRTGPGITAAVVLAVAGALAIRRAARGQSLGRVAGWHLALLVVLFALGARSAVWIAYLALGAMVVLLFLLDEIIPRDERPLLVALCAVVLVAALTVRRLDKPFAVGEDPDLQPSGAVRFAKDHGLRGPMLDSFEFGGYLLYRLPEAQVLVDGRLDTIYPIAFVLDAIRSERHSEVEVDPRHQATWAIGSNHRERWTHHHLASDPAWAMVYWSSAASVYVRRDAHPELAPAMFRYLHPASLDGSTARAVAAHRDDPVALEAIGAELQRAVGESPASVPANAALAVYFDLRGPAFHARRDEVMRLLRLLAPGSRALATLEARFRRR